MTINVQGAGNLMKILNAYDLNMHISYHHSIMIGSFYERAFWNAGQSALSLNHYLIL